MSEIKLSDLKGQRRCDEEYFAATRRRGFSVISRYSTYLPEEEVKEIERRR